jgi:hypothetical protein
MQSSRFNSTLETATNVAVLMAGLGVLTALSWGYFAERRRPSVESGLQKGNTLPKISGVDSSSWSPTLLIAMSTKCGFCTESISFYNKLAELEKTHRRIRIVAIFPEEEGKVEEYARQNKIDTGITSFAGANLQALRINSTPTLILLDDRRQILDFWIGALRAEEQKQVIQALEQRE